MRIGHIQKTTLIDFPGKLACTIFTQGCNFRCGYCHNPELLDAKNWRDPIPEEEFFNFLESRKDRLQGVCITGGEPTIYQDLPEFVRSIKDRGFLVKLDSQGSHPEILKKLFEDNLIDYIAMDIKGPLHRYNEIINSTIDKEKVAESISMIMNSKVDYEFRTTVVKNQLLPKDFINIGKMLRGAKKYYLQKFIPTKTSDPEFMHRESYSTEEMEKLQQILFDFVEYCGIR